MRIRFIIALLCVGFGQDWDAKIVIHPSVWDITSFTTTFTAADNSLHFLVALSNSTSWSYQYRRLENGRYLSPWSFLTEYYSKPDSVLLPTNNNELIFFFQNTSDSGDGPLMATSSFDNGKTWGKYFPIDPISLPRSSLGAAHNPLNGQVWLYFFYFTPTHRVGYVTRPPGSSIFSAEKPALDPSFGHFMEGVQAVITYNKSVPLVHLFAVSEKGLLYAYSKDNGVTYKFASVVAPLPDAYDVAANYEYSNTTLYVAVENEVKWTSDFGATWDTLKITDKVIRQVSISMCKTDKVWKIYYLGVADDDVAVFGYIKEGKFVKQDLPFEKADIQINPKVVCYNNKGRARIAAIMGDSKEGVKAYFANA